MAHQLPRDAGRVSSIKHFLQELRDHHVLVRTGNTAVFSYFNHQGGLRSHPLYRLAHQSLGWSQGKLLSMRTVHIPGHLNMGADILSRQGPRTGEWMLHPKMVKQTWKVWPGSDGPVCDSREIALMDVTPEVAHLVASGLSTEVAETILQHRAPSTRKLYTLKWKLSLLDVETASSTQSTAQLVQFWSTCRPVSLQGCPTPP